MRTQPVPDQTAIGTIGRLIGYGCGKEAKGNHQGKQMDAAPAAYACAECATL